MNFRRVRGHEYLQAIRNASPFRRNTIQAAVIAAASDGAVSIDQVLKWDDTRRTGIYRTLVVDSPDIDFLPRFHLNKPKQENYDKLKEVALPARAETRLDPKEMESCADYVVEFLVQIGFQQAFKEIVVTGSVPESMTSRDIPGFYSTIAGSACFAAAVGYSGGNPGEEGCEPHLFVNPLIMRRCDTDRQFILSHEILHYLLDHIHRLLLDEDAENSLHNDYGWVPQALVDQTNEILREALVEVVLLDIHGAPRPEPFVTDLIGVQPTLHEELLAGSLQHLDEDEQETVRRRFNAECLFDIIATVPSYWTAKEKVPEAVSSALTALPTGYAELYSEMEETIPKIVEDAFISVDEFSEMLRLALRYPHIVQDITLLRPDC